MSHLRLLYSRAALCLWAICLCIGFSIVGSDASRTVVLKQETKFGYAKVSLPMEMKRWDEALFILLSGRAKAEMADFLKRAEKDAAARPSAEEAATWNPYEQSVSYVEQFRTSALVSYLEIIRTAHGKTPETEFKTINFDKEKKREFELGDILDGAEDRSKTLEALANYARADLKDKTGEEDEDSDALLALAKPDLSVFERFTLCPSTKLEKAAGLTIHFPPTVEGPFAGSDFHVTIPYTVFSKFLKPGAKALFTGEPRQAPFSLQDTET